MKSEFAPPFSKEVRDEAVSYELSDSVNESLPDGLDGDLLSSLYVRSREGDARVIPELKRFIAKYPDFAPLKNYLVSVYHLRGQSKKASEAGQEMFRCHPDYLFARLAEAQRHLQAENWEEVKEILGGTLKLRDIYAEGQEIHESHWTGYYTTVAAYYAYTGNLEVVQGIIKAFEHYGIGGEDRSQVEDLLGTARMAELQKRMDEDERMEIAVDIPPMPDAPNRELGSDFHFSVIRGLFEYGLDFPPELLDEILGLDREKVIADLEKVIRDEIANGPLFWEMEDEPDFSAVHALMLLSEMKAVDSLETVLAALSQHPDLLDQWFGDFISWQPFTGVVGEDLPRLTEWMKTPGIPHSGRSYAAQALARRCLAGQADREKTIAWFSDLLEFYGDAREEDNVLDTRVVTNMVGDLLDLRAAECLPLIRRLFDKRLVAASVVGDFESVVHEMESAPDKLKTSLPSMIEFYANLVRPTRKPDPAPTPASLPGNDSGAQVDDRVWADVGRNDPCPCGSGKKYKKCCLE